MKLVIKLCEVCYDGPENVKLIISNNFYSYNYFIFLNSIPGIYFFNFKHIPGIKKCRNTEIFFGHFKGKLAI